MSRGQAAKRSWRSSTLTALVVLPAVAYGSAINEQPELDGPATRMDPRTPYFEHRSSLPVGDKGERRLDVGVQPGHCGTIWAFDHAELTVLDSRFGDAQLVEIPESGCIQCRPLIVRWYHEPTGRIHFKVDVYRRAAEQPCSAKERLGADFTAPPENR